MNAILLPQLLPYLKKFKLISFKEGATVVHADDPLSGMFYITKGYVREMAVSKYGMEFTLSIFSPGYCFPLSQLFLNRSANNNFQSLTPLKVLHIPRRIVLSLLKNNPSALLDITKKLTENLVYVSKKLELMVFEGSYEKVAFALVELAKYFGEKSGKRINITRRFTHYDIATIAGLTRETTSKILEDLGKKGLIEYKDHKLIITDISIFKQLI